MKTKLVVVLGKLASGGSERVLSVLSPYFCDNFDEVIYMLWEYGKDFYKLDDRVRKVCPEVEAGSKSNFKKLSWARKFLKKENPSVVLSFMTKYNLLMVSALMGTDINHVLSVRADPRYAIGGAKIRLAQKIFYIRAKAIICQTQCIKDYYHEWYLRKKADIIYNPISIPAEKVGIALKTPKANKFVAVGRLVPYKRQELMIEAFNEFSKKHPDYTFEIYGEGPLREPLEAKIKELGLEGKVLLKGTTNDIVGAISNAKAFVHASTYEGLSNAMIEGMVAGLPTLCTRISGAIDFINDGENGILIEPTIENISQNLCKLVEDEDYAHKLGENATKLYELLDTDIIAKQWIDCLKKFAK